MSSPYPLSENLAIEHARAREWDGVRIELTDYACTGRVLQRWPHEQDTRLSVILDEVGRDRIEPRLGADQPSPIAPRPRDLHFTPAGMALWGYSADVRFVQHAALRLDATRLRERLHLGPPGPGAQAPRLQFSDDRLWTLVKLLSDAIDDPDPSTELYGDSLTTAIAARLFEPAESLVAPNRGLSALQLRDAISYLEAHLPARVALADLAALAGMSPSHYARAFKVSTGSAPYQWQLQARVEQAKCLLLDTNASLQAVAEATGFADAVHFGRTFRKLTGATPAAWRADRLN